MYSECSTEPGKYRTFGNVYRPSHLTAYEKKGPGSPFYSIFFIFMRKFFQGVKSKTKNPQHFFQLLRVRKGSTFGFQKTEPVRKVRLGNLKNIYLPEEVSSSLISSAA